MDDKIFDQVHDVDLEKTMKESYIEYAMSVIASRALPDVRDGLKPVQRRVLYSMIELNNGPDKPHRKCCLLYTSKATREVDNLVFKQEINYIREQASQRSYENLEKILDALEKTKVRLRANVNTELALELLFLSLIHISLYGFSQSQAQKTQAVTESDGTVYDISITDSADSQGRVHVMACLLYTSRCV